jgi:DNA ligase-1
MAEFPTLYGRATTGKIKMWKATVTKLGDGTAYLEVEHGYVDGKKQVDSRMIEEGKNIGKANETTPYEQACSEARSLSNKKKDEGYAETIDSIKDESAGFFLPMLAQKWQDHAAKIKFPAVIQPKYDGFRCLAKKEDGVVYLWSRKGKMLDVPTEIKEELSSVLQEGECTDGELYRHGWGFQRIASAIKKRGPDTPGLHYYIYDNPVLNKTFQERFIGRWMGSSTMELFGVDSPISISGTERLRVVPTNRVENPAGLTLMESKCIEAGFEGLMVRNLGGFYQFKNRSYDLQKVKQFEDAEYEIIGGKEGQGREAGMVIFKCKTEAGIEFDVRPKGTMEERSAMWNSLSSYIGKPLTVKFQGLTDDGRPRFPVGLHIRPDWD